MKANNICNIPKYKTARNKCIFAVLAQEIFYLSLGQRQADCVSDASTKLKFSYGIKVVLST